MDLADTSYAAQSRDMMLLDRKLRTLGAATVLNMPSIAVIGKQSVGKSSLVEALSGIKVPRDRDTTTRCPIEVRMTTSSDPWSCQLSIRSALQLLQGVTELPFGNRLSAADDVELMLRRAQLAILNPELPIEKSRHFREQAHVFQQRDLRGPTLMNLTFVDLPGIINTTDTKLVKGVEDLVISHIKQPNTLILLVMAMNDEVTNQKADGLAKRVDPDGKRTIGVLTKPDMISATGEFKTCQYWLDVLEGRKLPLTHGYYVTRQPNEKELHESIGNEDARRLEMSFFETSFLNSSPEMETRCGTHKLAEAMSQLLVEMMRSNLPNLEKTVKDGIAQCRNDLAALPAAPSTDHLTSLFSLLSSFSAVASNSIIGTPKNPKLVQNNMAQFRTLKSHIMQTAPNFQPWKNKGEYEKLAFRTTSFAEESWTEVYRNIAPEEAEEFGIHLRATSPVYVEDIQNRIKGSTTRELKGNVPFSVKVSLIAEFANKWRDPTLQCFTSVSNGLESHLLNLIAEHFSRFRVLKVEVTRLVQELLCRHREKARETLDVILELEVHPFTQNDYHLTTFKNAWLNRYKSARMKIDSAPDTLSRFTFTSLGDKPSKPPTGLFAPLQTPSTSRPISPLKAKPAEQPVQTPDEKLKAVGQARESLQQLGYSTEEIDAVLERQTAQHTPYELEFSIMAEVRAYFQVTSMVSI
ncbi:hypothetical protein FRC03_004699 [Tulasnella sp. 419]|nr:hypothetical protein FRC03_004699 [Tulasnella sp. 419]